MATDVLPVYLFCPVIGPKNKTMQKILSLCALCFYISLAVGAQSAKAPKAVVAEGTIIAGYVDQGGFINFTGPSLKWSKKPNWSLGIGMLPGLRIKEDRSVAPAKKNPAIFPSLGFGITYTYKHLALQVPLYYNAKTGTADGNWNIGLGLGYKL